MSGSVCRNGAIRCAHCGRFMSRAELEKGHCDYTPDTDFSTETIEWLHGFCYEKELVMRQGTLPPEGFLRGLI